MNGNKPLLVDFETRLERPEQLNQSQQPVFLELFDLAFHHPNRNIL